MKNLKKYYQSDIIFFSFLFLINILLFLKSFTFKFFLDDYFFLKISRADNLFDILQFFAPGKAYFYRPLTTEFFYFIIHTLNENTYITHWIIWIIYFTGIYFLYKCIYKIFGKKQLARLFIVLYALHFTHVFQLYHIATFIEVALFTFLVASFYSFLCKKYVLSIILFICALLSKETALLFPVLLITYLFITSEKKFHVKTYLVIMPYLILGCFSIFLFKSSVAQVAQDEVTYTPHFSSKLIINNTMWYTFWGLGLPNYLPDYLQSIFSPPIPDFWKVMKSNIVRYHLYSIIIYLITIFLSTLFLIWKSIKKERIFLVFLFAFSTFGFLLFISPTLTIIHKWMVRLTVPLIFLVLFQSYAIHQLFIKKYVVLATILVIMYAVFNFYGTQVHENSSNFALENRFAQNAEKYLPLSRNNIMKYYDTIYFLDDSLGGSLWGKSKKLEITFHGVDFLDYYFHGKDMNVIWGYKNPLPPKDAYVIPSSHILMN